MLLAANIRKNPHPNPLPRRGTLRLLFRPPRKRRSLGTDEEHLTAFRRTDDTQTMDSDHSLGVGFSGALSKTLVQLRFIHGNLHLFTYHLQESFVIHLFIGDVLAIMKNCISSSGSWCVLGIFLALKMIGFESYAVFLCQRFDDGDILAIERTLVSVE